MTCLRCGSRSLYRDEDGFVRCLSCSRVQNPPEAPELEDAEEFLRRWRSEQISAGQMRRQRNFKHAKREAAMLGDGSQVVT